METKNTEPIKNLDEFVAKIDEMKKKTKWIFPATRT